MFLIIAERLLTNWHTTCYIKGQKAKTMEHKTIKATHIQSRHSFHLPADKLQDDPAYLDDFITFCKASGTRRALVEVLTLRSIPVSAISTLLQNGLQVDVFLKTSLNQEFDLLAHQDLISNLAGLQVERLILFDRPNRQEFWKPETWIKPDLLDIFLEKYILLAEKCLEKNIQPVFPPLQPAGDYWDTAFLRLSLLKLKEKGKTALLESLMLSAYSWSYGRSLDWGAGGPECWPSSTPYYTPENSQDQQGFRAYEWYQAHARAVLDISVPILLLEAGRAAEYGTTLREAVQEDQSATLKTILNRLYPDDTAGEEMPSSNLLPDTILSCNFLVELDWTTLKDTFATLASQQTDTVETQPLEDGQKAHSPDVLLHYLLLPDETWQVEPHKTALLEPFISRYHPVVGTSLDEALAAKEVTLVITAYHSAEEALATLEQQENLIIRKIRLETNPVVEEVHDH